MVRYAQTNPEGGDLLAPPEVLALVPEYLQHIDNGEVETRDITIRLRVTPEERATIQQDAEETGQTLSQYIRSKIL